MRITVTQMSNEALLRQLLDAIPSCVFLVDRDVSVLDYNAAAGQFLGAGPKSILGRRPGEVFHCLHSRDVPEGCGHGPCCRSCRVRGAVAEAFTGRKIVRRHVRMDLRSGRAVKHLDVLVTASPFEYQGHERVVLILEELGAAAARRTGLAPSHARRTGPTLRS
ncbi:MAG TPA: PAS domain-containing protein [Candidatus Acidoferrum sp.]|nr:PAS domain-containing protein [Candidatus Acidoferrum sp.]